MSKREYPQDASRVLYNWFSHQWWTEELYLALANNENAFVELSDGKVVIHQMPTPQHQTIVLNLASLFNAYAEGGERGKVFIAPMPIKLWTEKFREPDIMFYLPQNIMRVSENYAGIPDLVVEVTSVSTRGLDMIDKMYEYAKAGIPEYWLIDQEARTISVYTLRNEAYSLDYQYRIGEKLRSHILDKLEIVVGDSRKTMLFEGKRRYIGGE